MVTKIGIPHIRALAAVSRAVLPNYYAGRCCIAATRVGLMVLERGGVPARPLLTGVEAANFDWVIGKGHPYSMACDASCPGDGLPGHIVIVGGNQRNRFLLDLSAYQMDRPQHGVFIPSGIVIAPIKRPMFAHCTVSSDLQGLGRVTYKAQPTSNGVDWRQAPDWTLAAQGAFECATDAARALARSALSLGNGAASSSADLATTRL